MREKRGFRIGRWMAQFLVVMFILPTGNALDTAVSGNRDVLIEATSWIEWSGAIHCATITRPWTDVLENGREAIQ